MGAGGVVRLAETEADLRSALDEALAHPDRFSLSGSLGSGGHGRSEGWTGSPSSWATCCRPVGPERAGARRSTSAAWAAAARPCWSARSPRSRGWRASARSCTCGSAACATTSCAGAAPRSASARSGSGSARAPTAAGTASTSTPSCALKASVDRTRHARKLLAGDHPDAVAARAFARRLRRYGDLLTRLYAAVLEVSGAEMVVDASKHASTALVLAATPSIDLKVLHVVRDSPAVAYSWTKEIPRPEAGPGEFMATWSPAQTGAALDQRERAARPRCEAHGTPTQLVRYEDFAADPREPLTRLLAFLGRTDSADALSFVEGALAAPRRRRTPSPGTRCGSPAAPSRSSPTRPGGSPSRSRSAGTDYPSAARRYHYTGCR